LLFAEGKTTRLFDPITQTEKFKEPFCASRFETQFT
jgi:hypothetical protein